MPIGKGFRFRTGASFIKLQVVDFSAGELRWTFWYGAVRSDLQLSMAQL